eukprot:Nitzschia sp. Nitz4//scaffold369_size34440//13465//14121//NITZ4_007841-RA/size34440-processed-gene-0.14-mRNA-1//1//CDS//3329549362//2591//frame0
MTSNNSSCNKRGRRVSFKGRVQVRRTEIVVDDTEDVREVPTWYSQYELQQMRKRQVKVMMSLDKVGDADKEVLKNIYAIDTFDSKRERQDRVFECRSSVLREQERQWDEDESDVVSLSRSCQVVSAISGGFARERASAVAQEVQKEIKKEIDTMRMPHGQESTVSPNKVDQLKDLEQLFSPHALKAVQNRKLTMPHWKRREVKTSIAVHQPRLMTNRL